MEGFVLLGIEGLAEAGKAGLPPEQGWGHHGHVQGGREAFLPIFNLHGGSHQVAC